MSSLDTDQGYSPLQAKALRSIDSLRMATILAALAGVSLALDPTAADPLAPKAFWSAFGLLLLACLSAIRLWWGGRLRLSGGALPKVALAFLGALALSALLSPVRPLSARSFGAWALLLLWVFEVRDWALGNERRTDWLLWMLCACLALVGGMALAPDGTPGLDWAATARQAFGGRAAGSLGNPNFLGGYVTLLWPIAAYLVWSRQGLGRVLGALALGLGLLAALASGSRAAWLGLLVQGFLAAHLFFWSEGPDRSRSKAIMLTGLALGLLIIVGSLLPSTRLAPRVLELFKGENQSVRFRLETWSGSLQAGLERPLQGHGPGSFASAYPRFRTQSSMAWQVQHSYEVSHAENWVLQLWTELGLLGLVLFGALLTLLLWPLRLASRRWHSEPDALLALALLLALTGSLAVNLASLDLFLPSSFLPFAALAGLALARFGEPGGSLGLNPEPASSLLVSAGLLLVVSQPLFGSWLNWSASRELYAAKRLSQARNIEGALPLYRRALDGDALNLEARYFYASALQERAKPGDLEAAQLQFEALATLAPDYVLIHQKLGALAQAEGDWATAEAEYAKQVRLDPYLEVAWDGLAHSLHVQGRSGESVATLTEAIRFNQDSKMLFNSRGVARAAVGQLSESVQDFKNALRLDPNYDEARQNLVKVSKALKRLQKGN